MKKSLIVLLVLFTAVCVFAADLSAGLTVGYATVGTANVKATKEFKAEAGIDKVKISLSGLSFGATGTYQIDQNYSVEAAVNFVLPSKLTKTEILSGSGKKEETPYNKKQFKDEFGAANFFGFKANMGVGYILKLDTPFDVKVGGGLEFNTGSAKGTGESKFSTFAAGIYGLAKVVYPVTEKIDAIAEFDLDLSLFGSAKVNGKKAASGIMFNPTYTLSIGATYNF